MRAFIDSIQGSAGSLPALIVEPGLNQASASVLLFLHGKGEAGSLPNEVPLVCLHQTAPFQALLGRLPGTLVIAPQAPPVPSSENWNWRDHVKGLAVSLANRFANRRLAATGFSRGGLGVLQLMSVCPGLMKAWAVVDPQKARDEIEAAAILSGFEKGAAGWVRYGVFRNKDAGTTDFSSRLMAKLPDENCGVSERKHIEMALEAYGGSSLSDSPGRTNLYKFLGLEFDATG